MSDQNNQEITEIIVRDRRVPHQFSIHNRLIDQWLPIISTHGYVLYNFYVRLANQKDERSYPGYTLIENHLSMGRATISNYNWLLCQCGLIHIEPGSHTKSNNYYILEVPEVTPELLEQLRAKVKEKFKPKNTFRKALLKRLDGWRPIQDLWDERRGGRMVIVHKPHKSQMALPLDTDTGEGSSPGEHPGSEGEHPKAPEGRGVSPAERPVEPAKSQPPSASPGGSVSEQTGSARKPGSSTSEQGSSVGEHPSSEGEQTGSGSERGSSPGKPEQSKTTIQNNNPNQQSKHQQKSGGGGKSVQDQRIVYLLELAQVTQQALDLGLARELVASYTAEQVLSLVTYAGQTQGLREPLAFVISRLRSGELPEVVLPDPPSRPGVPQETCPGCGLIFDTWQLCPDCGRCENCCQGGCREPADPALAQAQRIWQTALGELQLQMTRSTFNTWLKPTRVLERRDGRFVIGVATTFAQEWLDSRLRATVERTLAGVVGDEVEVEFVVAAGEGG